MSSVLLSCQSISKSYQRKPLFEDVTLGIHEGDKIGLIGPNGAGKSTLLKTLAGEVEPDTGQLSLRQHTNISYVSQLSSFPKEQSVEEVVMAAITKEGLEDYERVTEASIALSKVGFIDYDQKVGTLSGGWKKRLSFACALVQKPDVLLLDEPTNHLDLEGIAWLEDWLKGASFAWLVITHDRYFLERVATAVMELHRVYKEGLFRVEGNYSNFLEKKSDYLSAQEQQQQALTTKMKREVEWLRRGPKARTTKAKYRIQEAARLSDELDSVKERNTSANKQAKLDFTATGRRTKELLVAEDIDKSLGGRSLLGGVSFKLTPKMRLGILGHNGSGKTTLLKMITGELDPDQGTIERAEDLKIVTFTQERPPLDQELTLKEALAPEGDSVVFRGESVHVHSWARRFLFRDDQLGTKLRLLSGGEQARVHIAKLMLQPADILLLDEPTNDLDIETLEILEDNLTSFPGALVLVTHDRYLLDRVTDIVLGLTPGQPAAFFGDFSQWDRHQNDLERQKKQEDKKKATSYDEPKPKAVKLSYKEKKELETIEATILEAEEHLESCQEKMADPAIASDPIEAQVHFEAVQQAEAEVERLYARWDELEAKKKAAS